MSAVGGADAATLMTCTPTETRACFCPDGTQSGRQVCSVSGTLPPCDCMASPAHGGTGSGAVCAEVANLSNCTAVPYVSKQLPSSLLFVVDRSRSMLCNLPPLQSSSECEQTPVPRDPSQVSKWKVIQETLTNAFQTLPGDNTLAALTFFSNDGECGVNSTPSVPLSGLTDVQRGALSGALRGSNPDGLTPIVGATILAYNHLHQETRAPGNRFVVLITDGAESCAPDKVGQLLDVEVGKAREANIRTFVIGAPGSEQARAFLSELAFRGGTASDPDCVHDINGAADSGNCHLDMTQSTDFAGSLAAALGIVGSAAVGCDFPVPEGGGTDINVQYTPSNGQTPICFPPDESQPCDGGANGWQFAKRADGSPDSTRVVVCGDACDDIKADPGARVDILVGCAPVLF